MAKVIQPAEDIWARRKQEMWDVLGSSISTIPERYAFNIPKTVRLPDDPVLIGVVPEECLAREGK